jgi:outer membrane lipoprotein-sorting protein
MFRYFLLCFLFLCLNTTAQAAGDSTLNYKQVLDSVTQNRMAYQTLSMRNKLLWESDKTTQEFQGTIRIQKDSLIWASLGAFGIEAARVLLTTDSFKIIYKLNNEYSTQPFSYLRNWLLFPVSFPMLQQLLVGERVDIAERATAIQRTDSFLVLYSESNNLSETIWVNPQNYTVAKLLLKDKLLQQDMTITFGDYNLFSGKPFAYKRWIEINQGSARVKLQMEITRLATNETLSFPFEINERYKKVE